MTDLTTTPEGQSGDPMGFRFERGGYPARPEAAPDPKTALVPPRRDPRDASDAHGLRRGDAIWRRLHPAGNNPRT
jgi:hypothetical protein